MTGRLTLESAELSGMLVGQPNEISYVTLYAEQLSQVKPTQPNTSAFESAWTLNMTVVSDRSGFQFAPSHR